jgi:hypothetical protein
MAAIPGFNFLRDEVVAAGAVPQLVAVLKGGSAAAQKAAAQVLRNLADGSEDRKAQIKAAGAVPPLVALRATGMRDAEIALMVLLK